jgi:hypothetical protein
VGRGTRIGFVGGAIACFLITAAASCTTQAPAHNGKPIIEFAGDSITAQSTDDINAHFNPDPLNPAWDIGIRALTGEKAIDARAAADIATQALDLPAVEVINLGTNDANVIAAEGSTETVDQVTAALTAYNAEFPTSCVVFVTIDTHNPSWGPEPAGEINDFIRTNFPHVADWDSALVPEDLLKPDNPHPNESGRQHLLAVEDAAIAGCTPSS